jgi:hypothetical protein
VGVVIHPPSSCEQPSGDEPDELITCEGYVRAAQSRDDAQSRASRVMMCAL